jgi:hypothetical protein
VCVSQRNRCGKILEDQREVPLQAEAMRMPRRRNSVDLREKVIGDTGDMCSSSVSYGHGGISIVASR